MLSGQYAADMEKRLPVRIRSGLLHCQCWPASTTADALPTHTVALDTTRVGISHMPLQNAFGVANGRRVMTGGC